MLIRKTFKLYLENLVKANILGNPKLIFILVCKFFYTDKLLGTVCSYNSMYKFIVDAISVCLKTAKYKFISIV